MNDFKYKFFLFIGHKKFIFSVLDNNNKIFFTREKFIKTENIDETLFLLNNFLNNNIISFEKEMHIYIKDIYIIIDYNNFINLELSTINNISYNNSIFDNSNYLLNIKNNVEKYMENYNLLHMIIKKYIVEGNKFLTVPKNIIGKKIFLEIEFVFLKNKIILDLKKIFSKYQISVTKVFSSEYLKRFINQDKDNIFEIANKSLNQVQENEVLINKKSFKNTGFFERFFNFFR